VNDVAISANGLLAASASDDGTIDVWDIPSGRVLRTLKGHNSSVQSVAMSADGRLVVSTSFDMTIKVWDISNVPSASVLSEYCIVTLKVGTTLNCCAMSANGKAIVAGDARGRVIIWELVGLEL
jgi:WD40 repeat protein